MKLKCRHCDSDNVTIDIIHTNLVRGGIHVYNRIDRECSETHANPVNEYTEEYVILLIKCVDCDKHTHVNIKSNGKNVELTDE